MSEYERREVRKQGVRKRLVRMGRKKRGGGNRGRMSGTKENKEIQDLSYFVEIAGFVL